MVRLTAVVSALLAAIVLVLGGTGAANAAVAHGGFAGHIYVYDDAAHIACAPTRATDDRSPTPVQTVENNTSTRGDTWATRGGSTSHQGSRVAAKGGGALVKYDADLAIGQLTKGGRGTASGLVDLAESQGWKAAQSSSGPLKYFDSNGIERLVIKRGSARTPGSDFPHVAIRNASGQRVDPYGNLVSRNSPGNHTPITWDLP